MSSCDNCKFTEWCKDKSDDILWCVQKSERNIAYKQGRTDAIDEFRKECESASYIPIGYGYYVVDMRDVRLVADLMKEQKNDNDRIRNG